MDTIRISSESDVGVSSPSLMINSNGGKMNRRRCVTSARSSVEASTTTTSSLKSRVTMSGRSLKSCPSSSSSSSLLPSISCSTVPLLIIFILICAPELSTGSQSTIRCDSTTGGYTGIHVSLPPNYPERQRETLILELQSLFKSTSDLLYDSSEEKVYWKEVTFIIPKSWSTSSWFLVKIPPQESITRSHSLRIYDESDFVVKNHEESFLSSSPLAIQIGGCGKPGVQIQMSEKFIINTTTTDSLLKSKLLLKEWVKYRFGVFDESGFQYDKMYPLYSTIPGGHKNDEMGGEERITSCGATSIHKASSEYGIRVMNRTAAGTPCGLKTNPDTGLPYDSTSGDITLNNNHPDVSITSSTPASCLPLPDVNQDVISSLMSHPTIRKVEKFCNSQNHNRKASNKQNNLCHAASVEEVMNRHQDFIQLNNHRNDHKARLTDEERAIEFKYIQESDPRISFIVDADASMDQRIKRYTKILRSSLIKFIQNLDPNSRLLMLDMKNSRQVHSDNLFWHFRQQFSPQIWGREDMKSPNPAPLCLKCAVDEFLSKLETEDSSQPRRNSFSSASHQKSPKIASADLILITPGIIEQETDIKLMAQTLLDKGVSLRVVLFPFSPDTNITPLKDLVSMVRGSTLHLVTTDAAHHSNQHDTPSSSMMSNPLIKTQLNLFDIFNSFYTTTMTSDEFNHQNILISRQEFSKIQVENGVSFNFNIDYSLINRGISLVTKFFTADSNDIKELQPNPSYVLKNYDEVFTTKHNDYKSDSFVVDMNNKKSGLWALNYKGDYSNSNETLIGIAYATVGRGSKNAISVKCLTPDHSMWLSSNDPSVPPVIYVSVTNNYEQVVQGAIVTLSITDSTGAVIRDNLEMDDDGLGSPDITKGDGIYSRYLMELSSAGFYGVKVHVRSQSKFNTKLHRGFNDDSINLGIPTCCGSSVPESTRDMIGMDSLERHQDCGFFHLDYNFSSESFVAKISDLMVERVDTDNRVVHLKWTSPHGFLDTTDVRYFYDDKNPDAIDDPIWIRDNFEYKGLQVHFYKNNRPPPEPSTQRIQVSFREHVTGYAKYSFAARSKSPSGSSVISNVVTLHMPAHWNYTTPTDGSDSSDTSTWVSKGSFGSNIESWGIVGIIVGSLITFVIISACLIVFCMKRRRKHAKNVEDDHHNEKNAAAAAAGASVNTTGYMNGNGLVHSNLTMQTTMGSSSGNVSVDKNSHHHGVGYPNGGVPGNNGSVNQMHMITTNDGRVVGPDTLNHVMSPVQSWSADVLLGHYGKVQQARERKEPPPVMKIEEVLPDGSGGGGSGGSCSTGSDNPSRESVAYDEGTGVILNMSYPLTHNHLMTNSHLNPHHTNLNSTGDWRGYENVHYNNQGQYTVQYTHQVPYGDSVPYVYDPNMQSVNWAEAYVPRSETPSESDSQTDTQVPYDPRYGNPHRRSTAAVSQV